MTASAEQATTALDAVTDLLDLRPAPASVAPGAPRLGVIEGRAKAGRNGAVWQTAAVAALQNRGLSRPEALAEMLRLYCEHMHSNDPVHTWEVPR